MIQPDSINALINSQQQQQFKTPLSEMLNHKMMAPEQFLMNNGNLQMDSQQQQQHQQQMGALITSNNNNNNNNNRAQNSNNILPMNNIQSSRNTGLEQFPLNRIKPSQVTIPINGLTSLVNNNNQNGNNNNNNHHGQHQLNNQQQQQQANKFGQSASSHIHQTMVSPGGIGQTIGQFMPATNGDSLNAMVMNNQHNNNNNNNNHQNHNSGNSEPFDTTISTTENPDLYHHASSNTNSQRDKNSNNNNNNNQGDKSSPNKNKGKKRRSHDNSRTRGRTGPKSRQKHRNPANRNHLNQQFYDHDSPMDLQTSATFPLIKYKYPYPPYRRPFDDYDDDEEEEETEINVRHYNSRLGQQGLTRIGSMTTICVSIAFLIISNLSLAMSLIAHSASAFIRHFGIEPNNDRRKHHATTRRKRDISDFNGLILNGTSKTSTRKDLGSLFINRYDDKNTTV